MNDAAKIIAYIKLALKIAEIIVKLTPDQKDDEIVKKIEDVLDGLLK